MKIILDTTAKRAIDYIDAALLIGRSDVAIQVSPLDRKKAVVVQEGEKSLEDIILADLTLRKPNKYNPEY